MGEFLHRPPAADEQWRRMPGQQVVQHSGVGVQRGQHRGDELRGARLRGEQIVRMGSEGDESVTPFRRASRIAVIATAVSWPARRSWPTPSNTATNASCAFTA